MVPSAVSPLNQRRDDALLIGRERQDVSFVVVDDHPVVAFALRALIERQNGWKVAAHVERPEELPALLDRLRPHVVIMDLLFPSECGLACVRALDRSHPHIRTVVYSVQPSSVYGPMCLRAGAKGYIRKDSPVENVLRGLRTVVGGGQWLDAGTQVPVSRSPGLSAREEEVLELLAQGLTSREIAGALCRSVKTVETHRYRIGIKLGARSAADLIRMAIRHFELSGRVTPPAARETAPPEAAPSTDCPTAPPLQGT